MTIVNQRDMVKGLDQMVAASPGQEITLDSGHSTLDSHHSRGGEGQQHHCATYDQSGIPV